MNPAIEALRVEIREMFRTDLHIDPPSPDADLVESGRIDSLGLVELLLQLERRFGVRVEMEDLELDFFRSVASIADFVVARAPSAPLQRATG